MKSLSVIAVGLGIVLLGVSLVWALIFPASRTWTEEKSKQMSDLVVNAHRLGGEVDAAKRRPNMHGGRNAAELEAEYKQVTNELTALRTEFEGKRDAPKTAAGVLRWAGIAFVVAGGIVTFANRG